MNPILPDIVFEVLYQLRTEQQRDQEVVPKLSCSLNDLLGHSKDAADTNWRFLTSTIRRFYWRKNASNSHLQGFSTTMSCTMSCNVTEVVQKYYIDKGMHEPGA